jgi:hypothetical protein
MANEPMVSGDRICDHAIRHSWSSVGNPALLTMHLNSTAS